MATIRDNLKNLQPVKVVFAIEDIRERKHHASLTQIPETTKQKD